MKPEDVASAVKGSRFHRSGYAVVYSMPRGVIGATPSPYDNLDDAVNWGNGHGSIFDDFEIVYVAIDKDTHKTLTWEYMPPGIEC